MAITIIHTGNPDYLMVSDWLGYMVERHPELGEAFEDLRRNSANNKDQVLQCYKCLRKVAEDSCIYITVE